MTADIPATANLWVHLFKWLVHDNNSSANKMAATQCFKASRSGEDSLHKFKPSIRMGMKGKLGDFDSGIV